MIQDLMKSMDERMDKAIANLRKEFATIRAGRANPALLDKVQVEYYGSTMPINQLGSVNAPEPRLLVITPWDKGALSAIEKAIIKADLGLTPTNDGSVIRIAIPALTEQRRQELAKMAKKMAEESRVAVRNIRRDINDEIKKMEKSGDLSEDDSRRTQEKVQHATDRYIGEIDKLLAAKEQEIMEV
ncbi:ribosome recycling factor [Effusibacillus lacus]|uniref:Ribosome-recycling factor n=1 Tax=Effusibacillus lacus TaxID=1348429 RepID=A0A292YMZ0_9BACL|nr:ribosome recycling factor [Effusibacillus lacus]TCS73153.1 ribosome recycling factor [Effusibacillus lacus]GAX90556.1 ribosome-recycling factor [Effusibacillus lacus]